MLSPAPSPRARSRRARHAPRHATHPRHRELRAPRLAGTLGYLLGALIGRTIGARGGRPLIERHGRWLHLGAQTFQRGERWFAKYGNRAVLLGRVTPVARSFISITAGALGSPLAPYTALTLIGSAIWCFGFAAAGWALGGTGETLRHDFRYADYAAIRAPWGAQTRFGCG